MAELDCLCGLAKYAENLPSKCRPVFVNSEEPVFELEQMYHPTLAKLKKDFVPNDTIFYDDNNIMLVTGPNMGGKSTLLR